LSVRAKKSFGQNFLIDESHVRAIAARVKSHVGPEDLVVEFGAGTGALTRALLDAGLRVHAIERDRDLIPVLHRDFAQAIEQELLVVHEANAVTFDLLALKAEQKAQNLILCGNLPYNLTSSFLFRTLEICHDVHAAIYLIQKEVADRICSGPNSRVYGMISVLLQARFICSKVRDIPRGAFRPVPKVDSTVIELVPRESKGESEIPLNPPLGKGETPKLPPFLKEGWGGFLDRNWPLFERVVKTAFAQRRKTLRNTLRPLEGSEACMENAQIDPGLRAENLDVAQFIKLSQEFAKHAGRS